MDSDSSSDSDAKQHAPKVFDETTICDFCGEDFVDVSDPNLPVHKLCGCVFHEYCLLKYGRGNDK